MSSKLLRGARTLTVRLTLWYCATFIVSSFMLFIVAYLYLNISVSDTENIIQKKLTKFVTLAESNGIDAVVQAAKARRNKFFVRIVEPGNKTVFISPPQNWSKFDLQLIQERPVETGWHYVTSSTDSDSLKIISVYLRNGYALQVGNSYDRQRNAGGYRKKMLSEFRRTMTAVMVPILAIGLAGGSFFAFRATRPIRNLLQITQSIIETGRMSARVPTGLGDDELNELGKLFNRMLERIETLVEGMRGSLDNVAHDLRTPMTRLRGIAETALQGHAGRQAQKEALIACLEESDRVLTLLNTLMDISEAETGVMKLDLAPVNVAGLVTEIVELYEYVAEAQEVAVSFGVAGDIYMRSDRNRMRQVLANLLDNAIKYTGAGGTVAIEAGVHDDQIVIRIQDTGMGIPSAEISKIWDRLHRGDASRSRPGLGLGLSLVAAVVHAHNGRIEVESALGRGSVFTLHMPSAAGPVEFSIAV
ncbi:MAG TPA: HAMP domain-containing sensor histidine kinase [Candidatus Binatia bacterium]